MLSKYTKRGWDIIMSQPQFVLSSNDQAMKNPEKIPKLKDLFGG